MDAYGLYHKEVDQGLNLSSEKIKKIVDMIVKWYESSPGYLR